MSVRFHTYVCANVCVYIYKHIFVMVYDVSYACLTISKNSCKLNLSINR